MGGEGYYFLCYPWEKPRQRGSSWLPTVTEKPWLGKGGVGEKDQSISDSTQDRSLPNNEVSLFLDSLKWTYVLCFP